MALYQGNILLSGGNNEAPDEIFVAEFNVTTFSEIQNAYNEGKTIFLKHSNTLYNMTAYSNSMITFSGFRNNAESVYRYTVNSSNSWNYEGVPQTPKNHASTHKTGGTDVITPASIGAAPTSHASTDYSYGKANTEYFGHVKLYSKTDSTSSDSAGVAATPYAVKLAYDKATAAQTAANEAQTAATNAASAASAAQTTANEAKASAGYSKAETLADATKTAFGLGASAVPNDVFAKMSEGVFSKIVGKYTNTSTFGGLAVGQSVFINVNGKPTEFLVAHQGVPQTCIFADSTYDGTFLIAKNIYEKKAWSWQLGTTDYSLSEINAYLNNDFYNLIDDEAKALIKQINVPYRSGTSGQTIGLLPAKVFLPSVREVQENTNGTYKPSDGGKFSLFNDSANRIARFEGAATTWWTRSGHINSQSSGVWYITESGGSASSGTGGTYGIRPVIVMQPNGLVYLDKNENAYIKQEYDNFLVNVIDEIIEIPTSQIAGAVKIATGSYVGTDKYGVSNPNTLTFDFVPRIVIVTQNGNNSLAPSGVGTWDGGFMWTYGAIRVKCGGNSNYELVTALNGTTLTWYSKNDSYTQQNYKSITYNYIAIG